MIKHLQNVHLLALQSKLDKYKARTRALKIEKAELQEVSYDN